MKNDPYLCPLLWQHVSCQPDGDLRVCCHGLGKNKIEEGLTIFDADKNILNHKTYQNIRKEMMAGKVPEVCLSCHKVEELGGESPRMKYLQNVGDDIYEFVKETKETGEFEGAPKELDITLGNSCNLKCRMCSPVFSDRLKETYDKLSLKYNEQTVVKIEERWHKDQINIPLLKGETIESLIFQGGEPLIYRHHLDILRSLVETGRASQISLSYDTNCTVIPPECLTLWKEFKLVELDISLDGVEKTFEYIRYGSDWKKVSQNIQDLFQFENSNFRIQFSTLLQAGLVHGLKKLIEYCLSLPQTHDRIPKFTLIEFPEFLSINAVSEKVFQAGALELKTIDTSSMSEVEKKNFDELIKLLESYHFNSDQNFKFMVYTKTLDQENNNASKYFDLIN